MVLIQEDDNHDEHVIYYLSRNLSSTEVKYQHVEKLALAAVQAVQCFRHYILSRKTTVISHCNPMQHILTRQLLGGKYSKWIIILQEFDLEFDRATSKKSLVFIELICNFPHTATEKVEVDSLPDESLFLISTDDIWYGDIIIYMSKLKLYGLLCPVMNDVMSVTKHVIILSSVILFTVEVLTLSFGII
jgi:hypothetical protein